MAGKKSVLESSAFAKLMIAAAACCWGVAFVVLKDVTLALPPFFTLFIRFMAASLVLFVLFYKNIRRNLNQAAIRYGLVLGLCNFLGYALQTVGLTMTTSGKNAFITSSYCVLVPFISWMVGIGRPARNHVMAAFVCLLGLGLVGLDGGLPVNQGDVLTFGSAICYAVLYAYIALRGEGKDVMAATLWEVVVSGLLSGIASLISEDLPAPASFTPTVVAELAMLSLLSTCMAFVAFNYAFTKVDPTQGALISSIESPIGAITSVLVLGEVVTMRVLVGFMLIFVAVVWAQVGPALIERILPPAAQGGKAG